MEQLPLVSVRKKDLTITYYKDSGNGGQKRNKTMSGVQIRHEDSGAMARDCSTPSQHKNKATAFRRLTETKEFQNWIQKKTAEALLTDAQKQMREEAIRRKVDASMREENLIVEYYDPEG